MAKSLSASANGVAPPDAMAASMDSDAAPAESAAVSRRSPRRQIRLPHQPAPPLPRRTRLRPTQSSRLRKPRQRRRKPSSPPLASPTHQRRQPRSPRHRRKQLPRWASPPLRLQARSQHRPPRSQAAFKPLPRLMKTTPRSRLKTPEATSRNLPAYGRSTRPSRFRPNTPRRPARRLSPSCRNSRTLQRPCQAGLQAVRPQEHSGGVLRT